jgi:AraC family transcriptional regulator, transcriptional activator FtrA
MIVIMSAKTANPAPPHTVAVVVYDGLGHFGLAVAGEIFGIDHAVEAEPPWYRLLVCGAGASVVLDNGLRLEVPYGLDELERADTVLVPSCEAPGGPPTAVLAALRRAHARGARLVSLCTGAFVLAAAGLLDGRRVTTHWAECAELAARHPALAVDPDVLYVDDGAVLTSAGSAAAIDLGLYIIRQAHGVAVANAIARRMVVPPQREGGQRQYVETPVPSSQADTLEPLLSWMLANLGEDMSVEDLAARVHLSPRTFARRFRAETGATPHHWLTGQRILLAQRLLEESEHGIDSVADLAGFGSAAVLRHHFVRRVGTTPQAYRRTFRRRPA